MPEQTGPARWRPSKRALVRLLPPAVIAAATGMTAQCMPPTLLLWNASASVPVGLYLVEPRGEIARGSLAVARLPLAVRSLSDRRGYVPARVPIIKRVAALPGDYVCARGAVLLVGGRAVDRQRRDSVGRRLPWWDGCGRLARGVLLLGEHPESFDGRYFGPVSSDLILGKATPLWLR